VIDVGEPRFTAIEARLASVRPRQSAVGGDGAANCRLEEFIDRCLGDEVRGTRAQSGLADALIVHRGEHDDFHAGLKQSELAAGLDAVVVGQRDIQNDDVGVTGVNELE
jgi:hypothetical protein